MNLHGSRCLAIVGALAVLILASGQARAEAVPVPVIFDTDMWGDIDDVLALAALHALEDRGEARILAITGSMSDSWCASYIDLIDTYYGRPDIPVGLVRGGVIPPARWAGDGPAMDAGLPMYTEHLSTLRAPGGALRFPHSLRDGSKAADAVTLLRRTLAAQPDASVVLIGVGFSTNFARLLDTPPDQISNLNGIDLVRRKAKSLVLMAGRFQDGHWGGEVVSKDRPEYNIRNDIPSAQRLFRDWPTPIVASGSEVGFTMRIKGTDIGNKLSLVERNPVSVTYRYMDRTYQANAAAGDALHDHKTFDLTAVLHAVRPQDGYFALSPAGRISVADNGVSTFTQSENGKARYLMVTNDQRARVLEAMTLLVTQPPARQLR